MLIPSVTDLDYYLFAGVDYQPWSNKVILIFRKEFNSEAMASVPGLPLILEQEYSPRTWTWFTREAKDRVVGFKYSK